MDFILASTFTAALTRLTAQDQKAVKLAVSELWIDATSPGLQVHRIDKARDPNFWSARVNRDIRLILHKIGATTALVYVDHHDDAYDWAMRRRIETHPTTGAMQIVEIRERVEQAEPDFARQWLSPPAPAAPPLFARLSQDDLLSIGVPEDWIFPVQNATEDRFFELSERLPTEAAEALLDYAATGLFRFGQDLAPVQAPSPYVHPDALRRFAAVESDAELQAALDAPWDKWLVFLHPSQRAVVDRDYNGPARIAGSAGTGKTVVALHRALRLSKASPSARLLLATFSEPLANNLSAKLRILAGPDMAVVPQITVAAFEGIADELFQLVHAGKPRLLPEEKISKLLVASAGELGVETYSRRFLLAEWSNVIDAWRVTDAEGYRTVPRLGRKNRLGARQRDALWPVFAATWDKLKAAGAMTAAGLFHSLADHYAGQSVKPFSHILVDEAQDLGVPQLRLLAALTPHEGSNRLFFAGDLGQRIFQQPFSWKALGVDVRGRSHTLKVNYRTSQQIRKMADSLLPNVVRDVDDREEVRSGTISVFEGPAPVIKLLNDEATEAAEVASFIRQAVRDGIGTGEIGVFVRSRAQLDRARRAIDEAGHQAVELTERVVEAGDRIAIGTMHLAKGLEYKAVVVMACDDDVLPLGERIDAVVDEDDLDEVYETERHLLYVACTRARDRLLVTGVKPGSEYLGDLLHMHR